MPLISIVIPVYNAENYLEEMLESVIKQTMTDIEIICVDDASTDGSLFLIEKFAERDKRIHIICNKENQGAARSRNIGFGKSEGSFVTFLDADDVYAEELIEKEYIAISRQNADMAVAHSVSFKGCLQDGDFYRNPLEFQWDEEYVSMSSNDKNWLKIWSIAPWNKMYKKEFVKKYDLRYQDLTSSNDVFFGMMAVLLAEKIALVKSDDPMIFHRTSTGKQISTNRLSWNVYLAFEKVHEEMIKWGIWEKYFEEYFQFFYGVILSEYPRCKDEKVNRYTYTYIAEEGMEKLDFFRMEEKFKDKSICTGLYNCIRYSYDSAWFREYSESLKWNLYKILPVLRNYEEKHKKIALWGIGERAQKFIIFCNENNYQLDFLIDQDTAKQGQTVEGMKIGQFEDISDMIDVIVVLRSDYYKEIREKVSRINNNIIVWDFEKYLLLES